MDGRVLYLPLCVCVCVCENECESGRRTWPDNKTEVLLPVFVCSFSKIRFSFLFFSFLFESSKSLPYPLNYKLISLILRNKLIGSFISKTKFFFPFQDFLLHFFLFEILKSWSNRVNYKLVNELISFFALNITLL